MNNSLTAAAKSLASAYFNGNTRTVETLETEVSSALTISTMRRTLARVSVKTSALALSFAVKVAYEGLSGSRSLSNWETLA